MNVLYIFSSLHEVVSSFAVALLIFFSPFFSILMQYGLRRCYYFFSCRFPKYALNWNELMCTIPPFHIIQNVFFYLIFFLYSSFAVCRFWKFFCLCYQLVSFIFHLRKFHFPFNTKLSKYKHKRVWISLECVCTCVRVTGMVLPMYVNNAISVNYDYIIKNGNFPE